MSIDPTKPIYDENSKGYKIVKCATYIAIGSFFITIFLGGISLKFKIVAILYILFGLWAIITPFWFWWEYFYVYREYGNIDTFELFKYGQQVAGAIWAGLLACLFALATSEHIK